MVQVILVIIVVIVVIAIISIVALVNFWEQSWKARNSMRMDTLWKISTAITSAITSEQIWNYPDCINSWAVIWFSDINSNDIADLWEPILNKTCKLNTEFINNNNLQRTIIWKQALTDPKTNEYYDYWIAHLWTIGSEIIWKEFQLKATLETATTETETFVTGNYSNDMIPLN